MPLRENEKQQSNAGIDYFVKQKHVLLNFSVNVKAVKDGNQSVM
jgi:hypothetical protein